jgi:Leucine-rich repeat (LRR) protein
LPDSLYNLTNLKILHLFGNQFEGSIKSEIGNLKKLKSLSIASNEFTGTIPSELGKCEKLGTCLLALCCCHQCFGCVPNN